MGRAGTAWLAFTDDDTLPIADWLSEAAAFAAHGDCRVFGGRIAAGEPEQPLPRWLKPNAAGEMPGHGIFVRYSPRSSSGLLGAADRVPFGANVFVRRDVFRQFGPYDESLWELCGRAALGAEDGEFGARLQKAGEPIGFCHEALVVHPVNHERCSFLKQVDLAYRYGWRDPIVFYERGRPLVEPYRLGLAARWTGRSALAWLRGDSAGAFETTLKAARCIGSISSRFSGSYRMRSKMEKEAG